MKKIEILGDKKINFSQFLETFPNFRDTSKFVCAIEINYGLKKSGGGPLNLKDPRLLE